MTIEVKELTINATVIRNPDGPRDTETGGGASDLDREAIISECVEQVMGILRASKER
ncbi:conserved hypothetical protein [Candidatus Desulfarcum epimagneticum]|uniref:Uncharacterized protein n=1 Tax=uncultured Desulfobacteraceae bacterium TaxID=218296 RepID=A0A484HF82_9BACT|nr:conserved hypothetical protein [uncultured Desulfobacteraceae bacterium]